MTLYAASNDRALIVSRNFWRNPRAGDVPATGPLIVPGIETIDVTAASTEPSRSTTPVTQRTTICCRTSVSSF